MANKVKVLTPTNGQKKDESEVEVITLDGTERTITVYKNFETVVEMIGRYAPKLCISRRVPQNYDSLTRADPLVREAKRRMNYLPDPIGYVRVWCVQQIQTASRDAGYLGLFSHPDNVFADEPKPYPPEKPLPGTEDDLPDPERDLRHPLERRLKQIYDFLLDLKKYPKAAARFEVVGQRFQRHMNALADQMDGLKPAEDVVETDEDGFQSEPANRLLHGDDERNGVE